MPRQINSWNKYTGNYFLHDDVLRPPSNNKKKLIGQHRIKSNSMVFNGITLIGIDPHLMRKGTLFIQSPLAKGSKRISGPKGDVHFAVKPNTLATIHLEIAKGQGGKILFQSISINFSHHVTIKNPSSSLKENNHGAFSTAIKDKIADVTIKNITIDEKGDVTVNGSIVAFGVIRKHLPNNIATINLPNIDEIFLDNLGLGEENKQPKDAKKKEFDCKKILMQLGAITQKISYEASLHADAAPMSFAKGSTIFRGQSSNTEIQLKGMVAVDKLGGLVLGVNGEKSLVTCSLGSYRPDIVLSLLPESGNRKGRVFVDAHITGVGENYQVDMFSKTSAKDIMPRRRIDKNDREKPKNIDEYNSSIGAQKVKLDAVVSVKAQIDDGIKETSGSAQMGVEIQNPYSKTLDRGISLDGSVVGHVVVDDFHRQKDSISAKGSVDFSLHPSEKTKKQFPEVTPISYHYEFERNKAGVVSLKTPEYGLSRFVRPVKNFEGHHERVNGTLTKGPLYPIASEKYFMQVEKITGAKLRHASSVELLTDNVQSLPARLKLINEARDYICFQTLVFKDDDSGWQIAQALVLAVKRGVKVYGIVDSLGNVETIKDLEGPHPIYEYLKNNGVSLKIYNSFLEDGLRSIFSLTKKYPTVFQVESPKSLKSIDQLLQFFERVIAVTEDPSSHISHQERSLLKHAIHRVFDGKEATAKEISISELKEILLDKVVQLEEIFSLIKRVGHATYRWHEKYLIADNEKAIVGGRNIAEEYLAEQEDAAVVIHGKEQPPFHDTDVVITGDATAEVYRNFRRNWIHVAQEKLPLGPKIKKLDCMPTSGFAVNMIQHRPLEDGDHNVVNYLLYNLRLLNRGEKAWFETAYFLPRGILRIVQEELINAALRGVDVRLITNSEKTSDFSSLVEASMFDIGELKKAGARVYMRDDERMVHAKVMVLGDKLTMIGSWNMDNRSASHDSEDVACIYNAEVNQEMASVLERNMTEHSKEISVQAMENRPFSKQLNSAAKLLMAEIL